jgi:uncharacterized protein (DUF58 family)
VAVGEKRRAAAVILCGAALLLASLTFDAAPLFVCGAGLVLLAIIGPPFSWLAARRGDVTRRLGDGHVVEDQPLEAVLAVRRGRLGLPGAEIHDPFAGGPVALTVAPGPLGRRRTLELTLRASFPRRGLWRLEPPALVVRDPLGLISFTRRCDAEPQDVLVLPRVEPVRWLADGRGRRLLGAEAGGTEEPFAAVDLDGLRPYRTGTPASRIHWSALARGRGLLERQLRADGEARPLIVLDARAGERDELDSIVRAAGSLTLELARRGGCRVLLPGVRRPLAIEPDLRGWPAVHVRLALVVAARSGPPPLVGLSASAPVFYLAACDPRRPPVRLAELRGAVRVLVISEARAGEGAPASAFAVSGCRGYVIGGARARRRGPSHVRSEAQAAG